MAKKVVASLQKRGAKDITKAIKMVRSEKTGSYVFREEILNKDNVKDFLAKK
ncbi:DUF4295 domain-containing protein [Flavobacteriales bacterium]|jgi:hypothetical protein|nr:DUF4295 domain-containing protein [Flavobacteriales bacterium]MDG1145260.1 DUF4295 domain-containing protein [Flavobacteriales bacterium]MDG1394960.1 DUF4295 domain-containing protein [Flavobacteriales bacterium]|tara:strand:+ start:727 stop:882 length:156 start_codon:yes stop_codon:yes gene_type:complete